MRIAEARAKVREAGLHTCDCWCDMPGWWVATAYERGGSQPVRVGYGKTRSAALEALVEAVERREGER